MAAVGTASAQTYGGYGNDPYRNVQPAHGTGPLRQQQQRDLRLRARGARGSGDRLALSRYGNNAYGRNTVTPATTATPTTTASDATIVGPSTTAVTRATATTGNDPYCPQQGRYGTDTGRTVATVIGGIAGAVLGSKVGGGSGTYAATAIGSMVGGMAGRQIYESSQRRRYESNTVHGVRSGR